MLSAITFIKNLFSRSALWKNSTYDMYVLKVAFSRKYHVFVKSEKNIPSHYPKFEI